MFIEYWKNKKNLVTWKKNQKKLILLDLENIIGMKMD
jgi:hypothetical protein